MIFFRTWNSLLLRGLLLWLWLLRGLCSCSIQDDTEKKDKTYTKDKKDNEDKEEKNDEIYKENMVKE